VHQVDLVIFISLFGEHPPSMSHVQEPKPGFRINSPGGKIDAHRGF
jgi:hypothetical protein